MEKKKYPIGPEHYTICEEIGQGVSASVHRALCKPPNEVVAIKILDFERENCNLSNVLREAQTMMLADHPNILKSHCSFVSDHNLWFVMPFMAGGSCLHILKAAYPDGFEEVVIATILREVLKGLEYLHLNGHIHRDVKAGNILVDSCGGIKLGDFGVSACLFDNGDRQVMRNTFVGTPCWMAPEVMEQLHGYNFKADIWSFGITALELAHGHAPFSKYPPMKVLLMTLQNAPPGLDYERDKKFSKSFKQMIASCLVKDPSKRPTAKKLLKHHFFKQARSNDYIGRKLLEGLPALGDCIKELKRKEEFMVAQKKMADGQKEELSQNEYKRGISDWNFNLEDMKAQASLIQDGDDLISDTSEMGSSSTLSTLDPQQKEVPYQSLCSVSEMEESDVIQNHQIPVLPLNTPFSDARARNDRSDDDTSICSSSHELHMLRTCSPRSLESNLSEKPSLDLIGRKMDTMPSVNSHHRRQYSTGSLAVSEANYTFKKEESEKLQNPFQGHLDGNSTVSQVVDALLSEVPPKASSSPANTDTLIDKTKAPVVQQKGRFKVTSENVNLEKVAPGSKLQKSQSMQVISTNLSNSLPSSTLPSPSDFISPNIPSASLISILNLILQGNISQQENILTALKQTVGDYAACHSAHVGSLIQAINNTEQCLPQANEKEIQLVNEISELLKRVVMNIDELQSLRLNHA